MVGVGLPVGDVAIAKGSCVSFLAQFSSGGGGGKDGTGLCGPATCRQCGVGNSGVEGRSCDSVDGDAYKAIGLSMM